VTLTVYLGSGHPWEALFENWESEFLQMAVFVLLTTFLIQKGSPESRRLGVTELVDADPRDFGDDPEAPWPVRRGGWILTLYEHSLGVAFVLLFLVSWAGHALGGFAEYSADEQLHHQPPAGADRLPHLIAILVRVAPELAERVSRHCVDGLAGRLSAAALVPRIQTRTRPACRDGSLKECTNVREQHRHDAVLDDIGHVFAVCQMAEDLVTDVVRSGVTGVMAAYFGTGRGTFVERG
jgi:Domain of unknown function (DUF6766)